MNPVMTTFTGRKINPLALREEDIDLKDIAHHLALVNRFGGATRVPLSVAQHCVYVSHLVPQKMKMQALLHDASEAYMGDIIHWLKQSTVFDEYRKIEAEVEQVIWRHFGCAEVMHKEVADADRLMCRFEAFKLMPGLNTPDGVPEWAQVNESEIKIVGVWGPWEWEDAERKYLNAFARFRRYELNERTRLVNQLEDDHDEAILIDQIDYPEVIAKRAQGLA